MARLRDVNDQRNAAGVKAHQSGFMRSEDGSLIIFGILVFVMILIAGGLGVDLMRFEAQRARLQATLDRAVLAAASLDQPLEPKDVVMDYVERGGLGDYVSEDDIRVINGTTARYVEVNASMGVPSMFLNFVGITELEAPARASAQQMASQTEISLVLDVSGSMGNTSWGTNKTRLQILQDSAETFINMVLCDPSDPTKTTDCSIEKGSVALNIVPYSEQVSVGPTLMSYLNATDEHNYSACVHFDDADFLSIGINEETALRRSGHFDRWTGNLWGTDKDWAPSDWTCSVDPSREITAFEDDVSELQDRILALRADGNTSIDLGMKWGAALLDPDFQGVVDDLILDGEVSSVYEDFPLSWDTRGVQKVLVLMTDGVNTNEYYLKDAYRSGPSGVYRTNDMVSSGGSSDYIYSVYRESTNQYYWPHLDRWEDHPYGTGTYRSCWWWCTTVTEAGNGATELDFPTLWAEKTTEWYDDFWFLGAPVSYYDNADKNDRLEDICGAAKAEGIKVFTIGFDTSLTEETILRNCASENGFYFDANGLDLETAFAAIAREVSKLKLVN